jgi:ribosomal protein S18 acetylase RimI-like enzyme
VSGITVRPATPNDAVAIARVKIDAWRDAYAQILDSGLLSGLDIGRESAKWRERILEYSDNTCFLLACDGDGVLGYLVCGSNRFPEVSCDGELQAIYVHPTAQRCGIGRSLLRPAVDWMIEHAYRSMAVFVFRDNAKGVGFYRSTGAVFHNSGELDIGGKHYADEAYIWPSLRELQSLLNAHT